MMNKIISTSLTAMAILILMGVVSYAHLEESEIPPGTTQDSLHIKSYDFTFFRPDSRLSTGKEHEFSIKIEDENGKWIEGRDIHGQILDSKFGKEIFYAAVKEGRNGIYSFNWEPSFAGDYVVQFIFRSTQEEVLQPSFVIQIVDDRGKNVLIASIIISILIIAIGGYLSFPKRKNSFRLKPIAYSILLACGVLVLGYSVSYYYGAGGEKGFVVCNGDVCDLAVHFHSQLEMSICNEPYSLPLEAGDLGKQHTHKEKDKLHFHALIGTDKSGTEIKEPEKLRAGDLFDQLKIPFTKECFAGVCNGDICKVEPGNLHVEVNGVKNSEFSDYSWKDGDIITIKFE